MEGVYHLKVNMVSIVIGNQLCSTRMGSNKNSLKKSDFTSLRFGLTLMFEIATIYLCTKCHL